jgi:hypothetical protein
LGARYPRSRRASRPCVQPRGREDGFSRSDAPDLRSVSSCAPPCPRRQAGEPRRPPGPASAVREGSRPRWLATPLTPYAPTLPDTREAAPSERRRGRALTPVPGSPRPTPPRSTAGKDRRPGPAKQH